MKLSKNLNYFLSLTFLMLSLSFMMLSFKYSSLMEFYMFPFYPLNKFQLEMVIMLDFYSLLFSATVLGISSMVILFSKDYMFAEKFFFRFHALLTLFVLSMMALIFSMNIILLILGWDGLGLSSYLLVVYYQSTKASNAGMLTALSNRVGDVFIMLSCGLSVFNESMNFYISNFHLNSPWKFSMVIVFLAAITKSAQLPFSAWLPAAMAAPTPVSALVHSSTLVTAGIYLLIRFNSALVMVFPMKLILLTGTLTMLMAGFAAVKEYDTKKIVALSTLSQLGLMMACISSSSFLISYFHLNTHAFMKAMLFLSMGNLIHSSNDYQDIRKSSVMVSNFSLSSAFMLLANLGLMGIPFIAGFYSKDMWLEVFLTMKLNVVYLWMFMLSVALTVIYSFRLMCLVFLKSNSLMAVSSFVDSLKPSSASMSVLWVLCLISGNILSWNLFYGSEFPFIPSSAKNLTLELVVLSAFLSLLNLNSLHFSSPSWFSMNLWGLPLFSASILVSKSLFMSSFFWKFIDMPMNSEIIINGFKVLWSSGETPLMSLSLTVLLKSLVLLMVLMMLVTLI